MLFAFALKITVHAHSQNIIIVPLDALTIDDAIQMAVNGDAILISSGVYTEGVLVSDKELIGLSKSSNYAL